MDLELWHFDYFKAFMERVFGKTLNENHFVGQGKILQSSKFFEIEPDGDYSEWSPKTRDGTFYIKLRKDNKQFLLPERYIKELPIINKKIKEVKIKKSDNDFWTYIMDVESLYMPQKKISKDLKTFIKNWNPVKHRNQDVGTFLKLVSFSKGLKIGVCGTVASSKNANFILLKYTIGNIQPKLTPCSKPVFFKNLAYNQHINVDEITSWKPGEVALIEEDVATLADDNPDFSKSTLSQSGTLAGVDIREKGLTFTFNPISKGNKTPFHEKFDNYDKIYDRYPLFFVQNKVLSSIKRPSIAHAQAEVEIHFQEYKDICMDAAYWYNNIDKEQHGYDRSNSPFIHNSRYVNNTRPLIDVLDAYCYSQEEFDEWLDRLRTWMNDYSLMIQNNGFVEDINMGQKEDKKEETAQNTKTEKSGPKSSNFSSKQKMSYEEYIKNDDLTNFYEEDLSDLK